MAGIAFCRCFLLAVLIPVLVLFEISCNGPNRTNPPDSPESGKIEIVADESFAPLLRNEITTFSSIYKEAVINAQYLPEMKVMAQFYSNPEIRLMIVSRRLYDDEKQYFEKLGLPPHEIKIAIDAVAFVISTENADSNLEYEQIEGIVSGRIMSWKQINPQSPLDTISLVFDNQQSSTVRFLSEKLLQNLQLTKQAFAVDSNPAVINYVQRNPSSIGVIGVSWVSDRDDSTAGKFLKQIRVVAVAAKDAPGIFYVPSKEFIYSMHYPFLRELFIISQEKHSGLGTGFATYVASDEGQRIVQRSGLMPIDNAVRIIELKDQF